MTCYRDGHQPLDVWLRLPVGTWPFRPVLFCSWDTPVSRSRAIISSVVQISVVDDQLGGHQDDEGDAPSPPRLQQQQVQPTQASRQRQTPSPLASASSSSRPLPSSVAPTAAVGSPFVKLTPEQEVELWQVWNLTNMSEQT